jgi:hypothetical protein
MPEHPREPQLSWTPEILIALATLWLAAYFFASLPNREFKRTCNESGTICVIEPVGKK